MWLKTSVPLHKQISRKFQRAPQLCVEISQNVPFSVRRNKSSKTEHNLKHTGSILPSRTNAFTLTKSRKWHWHFRLLHGCSSFSTHHCSFQRKKASPSRKAYVQCNLFMAIALRMVLSYTSLTIQYRTGAIVGVSRQGKHMTVVHDQSDLIWTYNYVLYIDI